MGLMPVLGSGVTLAVISHYVRSHAFNFQVVTYQDYSNSGVSSIQQGIKVISFRLCFSLGFLLVCLFFFKGEEALVSGLEIL